MRKSCRCRLIAAVLLGCILISGNTMAEELLTEQFTDVTEDAVEVLNEGSDFSLYYGLSGEYVESLQQLLCVLGYFLFDNINGYYGTETVDSVKRFQNDYGLYIDGVAGSYTIEMIWQAYFKMQSEYDQYYGSDEFVLYFGCYGDYVFTLQQLLNELGYLDASYITGSFGQETRDAVRFFQSDKGLHVDGVADQNTIDVLWQAYNDMQSRRDQQEEEPDQDSFLDGLQLYYGCSGDVVYSLQELLNSLGYLPASGITGYFGQDTQNAVKLFQEDNGFEPDGIADRPVIESLWYAYYDLMSMIPEPDGAGGSLYTGCEDDYVGFLQWFLNYTGYLPSSDITYYYGRNTRNAVMRVQSDNNLEVNGIATPETMNMIWLVYLDMIESIRKTVIPEGVLSAGSSGGSVQMLQKMLNYYNYFAFPVDGYFGLETYKAVRNFQRINGLAENGTVDEATWYMLVNDPVPYDPANDNLPTYRRQARAVLDSVGWDLYRAYKWSVGIGYYRSYTGATVSVSAQYGFTYGQGDCIAKAATFCVMARELGYRCWVCYGKVPYADGSFGAHAWCEIVYNGSTYVCDPDFEWDESRNGYMIYYGQSGTWKYQFECVLGD